MAKTITIYKTSSNDWQEYKTIRLEMLKEEPLAFNSKYEDVLLLEPEDWQKKLADKNNILVFAKKEKLILGTMNMTLSEEGTQGDTVVLHGAYVKRKYRGMGVGTELLNFLMAEAQKNREIKQLRLWVKTNQKPAICLYEKSGFMFIEKAGTHTIIMSKNI